MLRVRCKICGLTRIEDVVAAVDAGADALGFVFYPGSPRHVSVEQAVKLQQGTGPFVSCVGLFVNPHPDQVRQVLNSVPLDLLQFHGNEPAEFCRQFGRPYIKALRMKPELDPVQQAALWPDAQGFLLDTYQPGLPGGTGQAFDWQRFPGDRQHYWILAGGLTPDNVVQAIEAVQPYAVDVSGGVEQQPGIKCPTKINAFVRGVQSVALR